MKIKDFCKKWLITQMDRWDVEPGWFVEFSVKGTGTLNFLCIDVEINYKVSNKNDRKIEFTFYGDDEGEETCGRGWAEINGTKLQGYLCFHNGDDSGFQAEIAN